MVARLLLMVSDRPDWAELFMTDVMASGLPVARMAASAPVIRDCDEEVTEWYGRLDTVQVAAVGDVVVWLADKPQALGEGVVVSVGGIAGDCAGLREVARGEGISVVQLLLHGAVGCGVLDERCISTQRRWQANRGLMRDHAEVMLRDWLKRLVQGRDALQAVYAGSGETPAGCGGVVDRVRYLGVVYPRLIVEKIVAVAARRMRLARDVWGLALVEDCAVGVRLKPLAKPVGIVRADPFVARLEGRDWLFFEEYDVTHPSPKGALKCALLHADGSHGEVLPFMERAYHLSYPQIIGEGGVRWVLPESHAARRLEVLPVEMDADGRPRAGDVPVRVLMEGASVADATLWVDPESGERWLFASLSRTRRVDHAVELHVFRLGGQDGWELEAHPMNPIVRDCRFARCAGALFKDEQGRLIRPSQAHVGNVYGAGVHLMAITRLGMDDYAEQRVGGFTPAMGDKLNGVHHVCRLADGRFMVDIRRAWEIKA